MEAGPDASITLAGYLDTRPNKIGASIDVLGPSGFVRAYGLFDSSVKAYDFGNQVVINSKNYNTGQRPDSLTSLYVDLARRAFGIAIPKPYQEIYESLNTIYDSLEPTQHAERYVVKLLE